ncbi:MAG: DsrE family protein [Gammaproteobacteria bacterium]|nr:DsrE family protein [Gammaproteobacteria bacterium]
MNTDDTQNPIGIYILLFFFSSILLCNACYAQQAEGFPQKTANGAAQKQAEGSPLKQAEGSSAQYIQTPYADEQNVLFEFYLDEPAKIHSALYWLRSYMNTLIDAPYDLAPEFMNIIVLIHGTEIVTLAKKNYSQYKNAVERMRYYEQLGVEFRVCGDAADDYGYTLNDFHDFVKVVPSAIVELAHWQTQGYALIRPLVFEKKFTIEEIR